MRFELKPLSWMVTVALVLVAHAGGQTTWYVDANAVPPGLGTQLKPYTSIQYAIDQPTTSSGHTLIVAPGHYIEAIDNKDKGLTIQSSAGPLVTFLVNGIVKPAVLFRNTTLGPTNSLVGFTVYTAGNGVSISGPAKVARCILYRTQPGLGSTGIQAEESSLKLIRVERCTIARFFSGIGASPFDCAVWVVDSCVFVDNQNDLGYAASCNPGNAKTQYCSFTKPPAGTGGWLNNLPVIHPDLGVWSLPSLDFHLEPLSVCIDTGNPALLPDPDGTRADIGAVVYDPLYAEEPTTYCTGKVHSGGCAPRVAWSGTPTLSGADDFVLQAHLALDGMAGKFIWSLAPQATPFAGGNLCIAAPIVRGPILQSGGDGKATNCSGVFVWPVSHAYMQSNQWLPGRILYAQAWGRDIGSAFPEKSQLSDAIVFQILP